MTLSEKKVIVDFLKSGDKVSEILLADLAENTYPDDVHDILSGVCNAVLLVDTLENFCLNNDAVKLMEEIECNYTLDELQDLDLIVDQLRMIADENESFSNRIFEIGVASILEEIYKKYCCTKKN